MNSHSISMAGIHLNEGIHHVDHIGPLCAGLQIPLFLKDPEQYELTHKYYPGLQPILLEAEDFLPENISKKATVLLGSNFFNRNEIRELFQDIESDSGLKIRTIYCPHGNSDKGAEYHWMEYFAGEDCVLLYGQHMIDFLKRKNVFDLLNNRVITGNYRLNYYLKNKSFFTEILNQEIAAKFNPSKKTLLYAPTWNSEDTSFFTAFSDVLDHLPEEYNLIVKLHPGLQLNHLGLTIQIKGKYQNRNNIFFLEDFPLIYPILEFVDIYIGDMSSIGYDFLYFNKPMYFLNKEGSTSYLHQAGIVVEDNQYSNLYSIIHETVSQDQERFEHIRKSMYDYTFGHIRSFDEIKADIYKMLGHHF